MPLPQRQGLKACAILPSLQRLQKSAVESLYQCWTPKGPRYGTEPERPGGKDWIRSQNASGTRASGGFQEWGAVIPTSECGDSRCKKPAPQGCWPQAIVASHPDSTDLHSEDSPSSSLVACCIFAFCDFFHTSAMAMELSSSAPSFLATWARNPGVV